MPTLADQRLLEVLAKWLKSLELHERYSGLDNDSYARVQPWPPHERPSGWIIDVARQKTLALRAQIEEHIKRGDTQFSEALELMTFLANLVGSEHIERFIPLATPETERSLTRATLPPPPTATSAVLAAAAASAAIAQAEAGAAAAATAAAKSAAATANAVAAIAGTATRAPVPAPAPAPPPAPKAAASAIEPAPSPTSKGHGPAPTAAAAPRAREATAPKPPASTPARAADPPDTAPTREMPMAPITSELLSSTGTREAPALTITATREMPQFAAPASPAPAPAGTERVARTERRAARAPAAHARSAPKATAKHPARMPPAAKQPAGAKSTAAAHTGAAGSSAAREQVVADAVRLTQWGRKWYELAELIARMADRPPLPEVRRILKDNKTAIEKKAGRG